MAPSIRTLDLARYRCFRDAQSVALGRLTLVYGENNAGKSALVRVPPILMVSRTPGRAGLDLGNAIFSRAGFREVQWRGYLPSEEDPDLVLGLRLSDGSSFRWTFRWLDPIAVIQSLEIALGDQGATFTLREGQLKRDKEHEYVAPDGPLRLTFDGIVPRPGAHPMIDRGRDALNGALDGVTWLRALRKGPPREGTPLGTQGYLWGDGEGAAALLLDDDVLLKAVSAWFRENVGFSVEKGALGSEMVRLLLRSAKLDVPFPDAGEGLQQVLPFVAALERLRRDGGLLVVEEPESHLHPRLQRALAELVVSVLSEQPLASVMLETHSEVFLIGALQAAVGKLGDGVCLHWVDAKDGAATVEPIPLDQDGRPTTPRLEQAFDTMGVMRRALLGQRKERAAQRGAHGG